MNTKPKNKAEQTDKEEHFPLQKRLRFAFFFVSCLILLLWFVSIYALNRSQEAVDIVLRNKNLIQLINKSTINITRAGQLPARLEKNYDSLEDIKTDLLAFQGKSDEISNSLQQYNLSAKEQQLVRDYLTESNNFFVAIDTFFRSPKISPRTVRYSRVRCVPFRRL